MSAPVILVVDDNRITRKLIISALETRNYTVLGAGDGATARELFRSKSPDLVLLDLELPDCDSVALATELRNTREGARVPLIALSGFLSKSEEASASAASFDDVIMKPTEPSRLLHIVQAHLPESVGARVEAFGQGRTLIVVDDDPVQRKLAVFRMERLGFAPVAAEDGLDALEHARRTSPVAILADVMMPRLDGFGLSRAVRGDPALASIPVILVTNSYLEEADRELAERVGADALVVRTPRLEEATQALRDALGSRRRSAPRISIAEIEAERVGRVMRQLERQVALNANLAQRCASLAAEVAVLSGISEAVSQGLDVESSLDTALAACFDAGGFSHGALYLRTPPDGTLRVRAVGGRTPELERFFGRLDWLEERIGEGVTVLLRAQNEGDPVASEVLRKCSARSVAIIPVVHLGRSLGALLVASSSHDELSSDRLAFVQGVANNIGLALALAEGFERSRSSEAGARQQAALASSILQSIGDAIVVIDRSGRSTHWNQASQNLGLAPRSTSPERWPEEHGLSIPGQDAPVPWNELPLVRASRGEPVDYAELVLKRPATQEPVFLSVNARPLMVDGEIEGAVAVFRDISVEKTTQMHLAAADRLASVGMTAAAIAHEINNPLAALMANLNLVQADPSAPGWREALEDAYEAATRVRQIARDLKIFSHTSEEVRTPVNLCSVMDSSVRMAWNEIRHCATLLKDYEPNLPRVEGDESRLGQVFLNLLVNAAQAIPPGDAARNQIRVAIRRENDDHVVVEVSDTGEGIAPRVLAHLFTPLLTTKPKGIGTGLGLSICQRIIREMGGEITVQSEHGKGSTFRVSLPAGAEGRPSIPEPIPVPQSAPRRGQILVLDDDQIVGKALRRMLRNEHDVELLEDGHDALARIDSGAHYDAILCDVMMPTLSGPAFYEELMRRDRNLAESVIFVTGGAFTEATRAFLDCVPNQRLEKPFSIENVRALVNSRVR